MKNGVPSKGALLTLLTTHWFSFIHTRLPHVKTHFKTLDLPASIPSTSSLSSILRNRSMQVRRLRPLPLESIVRGYITGSAWKEYSVSGTVHGISMPKGLRESEKLEKALWTPSTKAEVGDKDENITPEKAREVVGEKYAKKVEEMSLMVYEFVCCMTSTCEDD